MVKNSRYPPLITEINQRDGENSLSPDFSIVSHVSNILEQGIIVLYNHESVMTMQFWAKVSPPEEALQPILREEADISLSVKVNVRLKAILYPTKQCRGFLEGNKSIDLFRLLNRKV